MGGFTAFASVSTPSPDEVGCDPERSEYEVAVEVEPKAILSHTRLTHSSVKPIVRGHTSKLNPTVAGRTSRT